MSDKVDLTDLRSLLDHAPMPGTVWRHRKGGVYTVVAVGLNEEHLEPVVVYCAADGLVWVRPLARFLDGRFTQE